MASLNNNATSEDDLDQKPHGTDSMAKMSPLSQTPTPPPGQSLTQSDSGICLTPLSQASVLSPQQTVPEIPEDDEGDRDSHQLPSSVDAVNPAAAAAAQHEGSAAASLHQEQPVPASEDKSALPDHTLSPRSGKWSSSPSPDDFTYQTKYLVLQFLHQSTTESHLIPLSHNSLSTTSESEPRFKSYAERFRKRWQKTRSHSSPTSPEPRPRPRHAKLKGSRSSPNLKDANFFKDMPPQRRPRIKRSLPKAARGGRKPPMTKMSPVQAVAAAALVRSVSENTENSETGTYTSDADDELDTSFDSSHQGSTTSASFCNRLAHFHSQAFRTSLPTVQSETESVGEVPLDVAEESIVSDSAPLPIMNTSSNSVDHQPVLTADRLVRVTTFLNQMRQSQSDMAPDAAQAQSDPDVARLIGYDVVDGDIDLESDSPLPPVPQENDIPAHLEPSDQPDEGAVSGGFEPHSTSAGYPEETEGAWGGVDDAGDEGRHGGRADRSRLRLDIHDQDTMVLMEAVHSLRQEIEEEISSFESEFEEAMQSHHSDRSWSLQGLSRSQSASPETAEIARRLARIGDEVQQRYFDDLDRAVGRLFLDHCAGLFTYENFREAAMIALDRDLHGWKQVATVLLYSQHVALHLAQNGRRTLHRIIDYTVQLLADTAAQFIIDQGGWASISALGISNTSSSPELSRAVPPTFQEAAGTADPATQDPLLSRRSVSAPDLQTPSPTGAQHPSQPSALTNPFPSGNSPVVDSASVSFSTGVAAQLQSSVTPHGDDDEVDGKKEEEGSDGKSAEVGEGDGSSGSGSVLDDAQSGVSANVLTGCAISVAVIGVGVAVAMSLFRG